MRYEKLKIHNVGPFADVDLDLSAIAGKLIAVCGANGAGKSTLLELLPAALYRETATRGSLSDLATARDSFVEVSAVNGSAFTIRQSVDNVSGKGEALVLDGTGTPLLESAKVRDADAWAERHAPPASVLYCSAFSAQKLGKPRGLVDISAADRKRVLLRALGIERLEAMAERARENARDAAAQLDTLRQRLNDAIDRTPDLDSARVVLDEARADLADAEQDVADARTALERAKEAQADANRKRELVAQRGRVVTKLAETTQQHAETDEKVRNNRMLIDTADAIRKAAKRFAEIEAEYLTLGAQAIEHARGATEASRRANDLATQATQARARAKVADDRAKRAIERLGQREAIEAAALALLGLGEVVARTEADIAQADISIGELERALVSGKDLRITALRAGLGLIAQSNGGAHEAQATLKTDDVNRDAAVRAPAEIVALRAKATELRGDLKLATATHRETEKLASRAADLEAAEFERAAAEHERTREVEQAELLDAERAEQVARTLSLQGSSNAVGAEQERLTAESEPLKKPASYLPKLDAAAARLEELEPVLTRLAAQRAELQAELAQLPDVTAPTINLDDLERALRQRTADDARWREFVASSAAHVTAAQEGAVQLEQLTAGVAQAITVHEDWLRLSADLGKDGLQALEIDAAIPELNTLANDLLHACFGSRFTVDVRTDRLSSDGKKVLEDLDIRVLDTEHGRDAEIETYSGGERVVIAEALSLALTTIACRRSGMQGCSLVRDESGAALDATNGRAYIQMLRRAVELIGADKCFFVSHSLELQELADARIVVADGTVTVSA